MNKDKLIKKVKDQIFELSPLAVLVFTPEMELVYTNKKVPEWTGYSENELLGKKLFELPFMNDEGRKIAKEKYEMRLRDEEVPAYDFSIVSKTGEKVIGSVNGGIIKNSSGRVLGVLIMVADITKQKEIEIKSQEELKKRAEELERLNKLMVGRELKMRELKEKLRKHTD